MGLWSDILDAIEEKAEDTYAEYVEPAYDEYLAPAIQEVYGEYIEPAVQEIQQQIEQPIGTQYSYTQPYIEPIEVTVETPTASIQDVANVASNVVDDTQNAWNSLPYAAQIAAGMYLGDKASKYTAGTSAGMAGINALKNGVTPAAEKIAQMVYGSPTIQSVVSPNSINTFHAGRAVRSALNSELWPALIGSIPETLASSENLSDIPANLGILPVSRVVSDSVSAWKKPLVQHLENYLQGGDDD